MSSMNRKEKKRMEEGHLPKFNGLYNPKISIWVDKKEGVLRYI